MKLALAQINPTIGDCLSNTQKIRQQIEKASEAGASLVVFPELAVTGYAPQDLLNSASLVEASEACIDALAKTTRGIVAVVGFVERNPIASGERFFNSAAVLRDGKVEVVYRKQLLPNYGVFDEKRYFEPGHSPLVIAVEGKQFGITICEDAWNFPGFLDRNYAFQPLAPLRDGQVDVVINLSASPFNLGKPAVRESLFAEITRFTGAQLAYCAQVGGNDDLIFDGGTSFVGSDGKAVCRVKAFQEDLLICNLEQKSIAPALSTVDEDWLQGALVLGLRDYVRKCGGKKVLLGLSGGIDSSVVAALAVDALGAANVKGVLLPSKFTSQASNDDALAIAKALGIETMTLPIDGIFSETRKVLQTAFPKLASLTEENIQPRLRMTLLMSVANEEHRLLLNTSNKSELAAGYATLYGDSAGALGVLGDLTKAQVYALARRYKAIPDRVVTRPPSAELREGQKDEDSLPPYAVLDPMVQAVVERSESEADLKAAGYSVTEIRKFLSLYRASEFKRRQFPPILRVSQVAFGRGRRIPVASVKPWI